MQVCVLLSVQTPTIHVQMVRKNYYVTFVGIFCGIFNATGKLTNLQEALPSGLLVQQIH